MHTIELDGDSLCCQDLYDIGYKFGDINVTVSQEAKNRIIQSRNVVQDILDKNQVKYGINTGFGNFATVVIPNDELSALQRNLIRSHCAGVGKPLPIERARMLLALRINVLAKGFSGISLGIVESLVAALNKNCISYIPEKGTVGASGDLAPLAHMALGMMGEGTMWNPNTNKFEPANGVLAEHELTPIELGAKEGLALINGTQFMAALGSEALVRAKNVALAADVIAALSLEGLLGSNKAFDARIHRARRHNGQQQVAKRLRHFLFGDYNQQTKTHSQQSEIAESHRGCHRVQDAYTLRCIPQVHGVVHDTIEFCLGILENELNSGTDNPMVFADQAHGGDALIEDWNEQIVSGGNFHGEYPAKALDYLAIGVNELANMSERRIARLTDPNLSGLPAFLVNEGGLNSGFMIAHCTASSLTSENKVYVHPASSDTLSTSASKEDHVSMGGMAATKSLTLIENVERVVAIELMCACQAIDFLRPLKTTPVLESVYELVRSKVAYYDKDRHLSPDIDAIHELVRSGQLWQVANKFLPKDDNY
ncbi:histidine ammonia-lyase [Acrasis kona]|uniref:Histidine ammonia-lyase n=1 Tax=Acrasis kona TaxID=1008807 RepID=A0AAW2ZDP7_9EUKA